jgi:integrase
MPFASELASPTGTAVAASIIHSLRVSFTTLALEGGANPKAVQAILGHSTLALTMGIYARATDRAKREAIGALPFAKVSAPEHVIAVSQAASA